MANSQESFISLVNSAYDGSLKLPAFQRDWKWETKKVISLYDSLRKKFPVGNFLFLEISEGINLSPREFEGSKPTESETKLVLDGQQRITAGISLLRGLGDGKVRYFLNLQKLWQLVDKRKLDFEKPAEILDFILEIDDTDAYVVASRKQAIVEELLLNHHWLCTTFLSNANTCTRALEKYEEKYPEHRRFLKYVVVPHFVIEQGAECPIITLEKTTPLHAVTKIFATINTTGKQLTPIEIVTAILFASKVNLRASIEVYHDASDYLKKMDPTGEVLLQTIALLSGKSPKKSLLPHTITSSRFLEHFEEALGLLDKVGEFLSTKMGAGLSETNKLVPYDSIFAPMALVIKYIENLNDPTKQARGRECLECWFVASALSQRYQEGVHNKQSTDREDIINWIDKGDDYKPEWISSVLVPLELKNSDTPTGARGRLVKCLINRNEPRDMLEPLKIGYYQGADSEPQYHHMFPKQFCKAELLPGWDSTKPRHNANLALNIIPSHKSTNRSWNDKNPSEQLSAFINKVPNSAKRQEILENLLISEKCVEILGRSDKKVADYLEFLDARFEYLAEKLAVWGVKAVAEAEDEDAIPDEDSDQ